MKKIVMFMMILFLVLFATNPTRSDFKDYANEVVREKINKVVTTDNQTIYNIVSTLTFEMVNKPIDYLIERDNYYMFSLYKVEVLNNTEIYIGILNNFFNIGKLISEFENL